MTERIPNQYFLLDEPILQRYFDMLAEGCTPQEARSVLPNSLKTEVVMTANIREWRHFLKLRCSPAAHPQMREVALILLDKVHWLIPVCFDVIWSEYHADVQEVRW